MRTHRRRGGVLQIVIAALLALGGLIWAGIGTSAWPTSRKPARALRPDPPTRIEVEVALERIGLTLKSVAAAGLSSEQITAVVGEAAGSIRANIQSLRSADIAAGQARAEVDRLTRLIQSGLSSEQDRAALATAQSNLATAKAQAQAVLDTAYAAGMVNFSSDLKTKLETLNANKGWDLPVQYRAANRSQADWVALRDALANDAISVRFGEEPDPTAHQVLVDANGNGAVSAATANLAGLSGLQTAWDAAVGQ